MVGRLVLTTEPGVVCGLGSHDLVPASLVAACVGVPLAPIVIITWSECLTRVVFVGGLHRSGTSLLAQALCAHPQITGLSETGVPEDEGQHLQSEVLPAHQLGGAGRFVFAPGAHLTEMDVRPTSGRQMLDSWLPHFDGSRPVLVEKSPPNLVRTRFLSRAFPDAVCLNILRHPAAVALAMRKWNRGRPIPSLVAHWLKAHETYRTDIQRLSPHRVATVLYEDFVRDPRSILAAAFRFIQVGPTTESIADLPDLNDEYLREWRTIRRMSGRGILRDWTTRRYEARVRAFGYSLTLDTLHSVDRSRLRDLSVLVP